LLELAKYVLLNIEGQLPQQAQEPGWQEERLSWAEGVKAATDARALAAALLQMEAAVCRAAFGRRWVSRPFVQARGEPDS